MPGEVRGDSLDVCVPTPNHFLWRSRQLPAGAREISGMICSKTRFGIQAATTTRPAPSPWCTSHSVPSHSRLNLPPLSPSNRLSLFYTPPWAGCLPHPSELQASWTDPCYVPTRARDMFPAGSPRALEAKSHILPPQGGLCPASASGAKMVI